MAKFGNVKGLFKVLTVFAKKHSPEILVGLGITGMATGTVLAVKATPKATKKIQDVIDTKNEELMDIAVAAHQTQYDPITKLPVKEVVKLCWKDYAPAVVTSVASFICIVGGTNISLRRNAALITACKLSEVTIKDLQAYKDKVVETIGEEKNQEIEDKVDKEKIDKLTTSKDGTPVDMDSMLVYGTGPVLYFDKMGGQWFRSDKESIRAAINRLNHTMNDDMYVSLNDFYDELDLGIRHTVAGDSLGWNRENGLIEPTFSSILTRNGVPVATISTRLEPRTDYSKLY